MQSPKTLQQLLHDHEAKAVQFLSTPKISTEIRSHLSKFIKYCNTHKQFTNDMVQLAFNVSYQELENIDIKRASFAANQVFGNEEPDIAQLFFEPTVKEEEDSGQIKEEISEGIQSQAQRLFNFESDEETKAAQEARPIETDRDELVALSLQILKHPQKNQTCLGHLQKMYSFFIRHEPIPVLTYFDSNPEKLTLLLKNISFSSISSLLAQLLTCQDKNKVYRHEAFKKTILQKVIEHIFSHIKEDFFFDGAIIFLDQILNATKQSYFEYFQDFKRISNYLVCSDVLSQFYQLLFTNDQIAFRNSSKFLELLLNRINGENQDSRYYNKEQSQPTMNFEIGCFVQNINRLIELTQKINHFSSITKIHYVSFVESLLSTTQVKAIQISILGESFKSLLETYKQQKSSGVYKNKIYQIIKELIVRAPEEQTRSFTEKYPEVYDVYFSTIKAANYGNTKHYNKNQSSGFDVDLIAKLTRKEEERLLTASKAVGKDLKRVCRKYDTRIASFQNSNAFSLEEQFSFCGFQSSKGNEKDSNSGLTVGKNNISIPVLHLPERYQNSHSDEKEETEGKKVSPNSPDLSPTGLPSSPDGVREVIEEQEVVVLTDKLMGDKVINLSEVIQDRMGEISRQFKESEFAPANSPNREEKSEPEEVIQEAKKESPEVKVPEAETSKPRRAGDAERARFYTRHLAIFA